MMKKKRNTIYPKNYCKRGIHCNVQCLNCTLKVWISCQVLPTICCSILYHEHNEFVTRITRRVPLVEQDLLTIPEHTRSPLVVSGVRVTRSLALCVCFVDRCFSFCTWPLCFLFLFDLRDSAYPFGIFKAFLKCNITLT